MKTLANQRVIIFGSMMALILAICFGVPGKIGALFGDIFGPAPVPVTFSVRDGLVGKVAVFHSNYDKTLSVVVVFRNEQLKQEARYDLNIPPSGTKEIGWVQNWKLESGETITISSEGWRNRVIEY